MGKLENHGKTYRKMGKPEEKRGKPIGKWTIHGKTVENPQENGKKIRQTVKTHKKLGKAQEGHGKTMGNGGLPSW